MSLSVVFGPLFSATPVKIHALRLSYINPRVPSMGSTIHKNSLSRRFCSRAAADAAGKPIYLELSSINPVVILPGALAERGTEIVDEYDQSADMRVVAKRLWEVALEQEQRLEKVLEQVIDLYSRP